MSEFYTDMQRIASGLLREFKQGTVKYVQITPGAGPVDAPGAATETMFDLDATMRGVSFRYVDKSTVVATDLQATFAVRPDMVPAIGGFMLVDGVRHKIVQIMPKPAAGTPAAYTVIFRK